MVDDKLLELASIYIALGDDYFNDRDTDNAIASYQKTLDIIDNYQLAYNKISRAEELAIKIQQAADLVQQGDDQFNAKEFAEAYDLYSDAYKLDSTPEIYSKINRAYVWTRISNDPEQFAIEIVKQYEDGAIPDKIDDIEQSALDTFSRQDVRITTWQVFRTATQNSYEVRYTIVIPEKNYFLRWLVRLATGQVVPLNDVTEELFLQ